MMLPDVGAGAPWTALWFVATIFLFLATVVSGVTVVIISRAFKKKDDSDKIQNERIAALDASIREQELKSLERDSEHQKAIYELQVEMLKCQKEICGRNVSREEYFGDFMRIQTENRESLHRVERKMEELITRVHERVDAVVIGHDVGAK